MAAPVSEERTFVGRAFCADVAQENLEPLAATASRVDHWVLVEYRGLWTRQPLAGSVLSGRVKKHVQDQLRALGRARLVFIRRSDRRREEKLACYFGRSSEHEPRFCHVELEDHEQLTELDFAATLRDGGAAPRLAHPLLLVCTHGKRDRCCARYGRPLYDALAEQADPTWVWQSTHIGGDRFAGNLVCLPEGLYYGRVSPADVWPVLDEYLAGRIHLDLFRGRCCYPFPVQAAERDVRAATGVKAIGDLRLMAAERDDDAWRVQFFVEPLGETHEVRVESRLGDLTYLTCTAPTLQRPHRFVATSRRILAAD